MQRWHGWKEEFIVVLPLSTFFLFSFFSSLLYKYSWIHVKVNAHNTTFDSLVCILSRLLIFFFFFFSLVWKKRIHCWWGSTYYALAIFRKLFIVSKFCFYCALMVLEKISIMDHVCAACFFLKKRDGPLDRVSFNFVSIPALVLSFSGFFFQWGRKKKIWEQMRKSKQISYRKIKNFEFFFWQIRDWEIYLIESQYF